MRRRLNKAAAGTALLIGTADAEQQGGMMKAGPAMRYRIAPATLLHIPALVQATNARSTQRRLSLYLPDDDGIGPGGVVSLAIGGNSALAPALTLGLWNWHGRLRLSRAAEDNSRLGHNEDTAANSSSRTQSLGNLQRVRRTLRQDRHRQQWTMRRMPTRAAQG